MQTEAPKKVSTYKKLIRAGLKLFSQYGYDATTTRMIAQEAKVNLSAISFHFSGKESLYIACLEYISKKADAYYKDVLEEIEKVLEADSIDREVAFQYISKLINLQIHVATEPQYRSSLKLIYWEQINGMNDYHPVTSTIFEKVEKTMAILFAKSSDISYEKAMIASRFINGSIISFGEHSLLVQFSLGIEQSTEEALPVWIGKTIKEYCLTLVWHILYGHENYIEEIFKSV